MMVENATDIIEIDPDALRPSGVTAREAPWLGDVAVEAGGGLVQTVRLEDLLPESVRESLFLDAASAGE
jgi:hypothetical protein